MKKDTSKLVIVIALVIGAGILFFTGNIGTNPQDSETIISASSLSVDKELHDFGDIDIFDGVVTTTFALTNDGPDEIVVSGGTTSCGCTKAELGGISFGMHEKMSSEFTIPSGETRDLTVIYDPLAHGPNGTGLAQRSVVINTNSSATPKIEVRIKAMVTKDENEA